MNNNYRYMMHVGYRDISERGNALFSDDTLRLISRLITENLRDIEPAGMIVPLDNILDVLNAQYESYRVPYGYPKDQYPAKTHNPIDDLINQTVDLITRQIRDDYDMRRNASRLTAWNTVLGDQNAHGIRSHPTVKLNNRRPRSMLFNMPL